MQAQKRKYQRPKKKNIDEQVCGKQMCEPQTPKRKYTDRKRMQAENWEEAYIGLLTRTGGGLILKYSHGGGALR